MRSAALPESCPRCGGSRLVRLLWDYSELSKRDVEAVAAGEAILGLNRRYFTSANRSLVIGTLIIRATKLPCWTCLECFPNWRDLDRLARAQLDLELAKFAAAERRDFDRAADLLHDQERLEATYEGKLEQLLRELIGTDR